jgi:hypothetical protein
MVDGETILPKCAEFQGRTEQALRNGADQFVAIMQKLETMDRFMRNGMSTNIQSLKTQVRFQWWLLGGLATLQLTLALLLIQAGAFAQ